MRLAYFRRDCDRADVFESTYLRCHHAHGLKVLRCFPHCSPVCCPHSTYRNCGASVSVRITGIDATSVVAYARFESVGTAPPTTTLAAIQRDVRGHVAPKGMWLHGVAVDSADGIVFEFNRKRADGWHYDWHGSSSTRNRSQKHVLQTYLFQSSVDCHLVLLATLASPPFTIASYRRAKVLRVPRRVPSPLSASSSSAIFASTHELHIKYAELSHSSTQETAGRLLQLFALCAQVPVSAVAPAFETRVWAEAARQVPGLRQPPTAFLLRQLAPFEESTSRLETVALAVISWFVTSSSSLHAFCRRHASSVYDNTALHEAYNRAVDSLATSLDAVLAALGESVASLSEQLPPPTVSRPLHAIGFEAFAHILRTSHSARATVPPLMSEAVFSGVWAMRAASPSVRALQPMAFLDVLWSWLGASGLRLSLDGHVFSVQSQWPAWPAPPTAFSLDHAPHAMHSWPHGASADAHYVGWRDADGLHLHVFAWPRHPSDRGHGLRTLWRWRHDDSLVLLLARDVLATTAAYDPNDDATRRMANVHAESTDLHLEIVYGRVLENEASELL